MKFFSPLVRQKLDRLNHSPFKVDALGSLLTRIRYGTGTPPPLVAPGPNARPFVRATDIKEGEIKQKEMLFIASEQPRLMDKCRLTPGELILVRSGVNTGDCAVVPDSLANAFAAYDLILTPSRAILSDYLNLYLATGVGRLQLDLVRGRAAQPHVNAEEVSALRVPVPERGKQKELVVAMEAARTERRAKLEQADALLRRRDTFLLEALGIPSLRTIERTVFAVRHGDLQQRFDPKTYLYGKRLHNDRFPVTTFGELANQEPDYGSGSRAVTRESDDQPKYIRITDFDDDGIRVGHEFVTAEVIEPECQLYHEDVLFARSGATAGKTFLYTADMGNAVFAGYCIRFRFDRRRVLPAFIHYFTKTSAYREWVATIQRPSGQPNINKEEFKTVEIPLPPLSRQAELVAHLDRDRDDARRLRAEAEAGWEAAKSWFEEQLLGPAELASPPRE